MLVFHLYPQSQHWQAVAKRPARAKKAIRQSLHPCHSMHKTSALLAGRHGTGTTVSTSMHPHGLRPHGLHGKPEPRVPAPISLQTRQKSSGLSGHAYKTGSRAPQDGWSNTAGVPSSCGCRTTPAPGQQLSKADNNLGAQGELVWLGGHGVQQGTVQLNDVSMELCAASPEEAANRQLRRSPRKSRQLRLLQEGATAASSRLPFRTQHPECWTPKRSRQRTAASSSSRKLQVPLSGFLSGRRTQGHANPVWLVSHGMQQTTVQLMDVSTELIAASPKEAGTRQLQLPPRGSRRCH